MLLTIDIGNTNTVAGCFRGTELITSFRFSTQSSLTTDELEATFEQLLQRKFDSLPAIDGAIISSVVPPLTPKCKEAVGRLFNVDTIVVGPGVKTGIAIKTADPAAVGSDRITNAVAAAKLFGTPALVIDFGTATSFDFVDQEDNYRGGIIAPGLEISLDSLVEHTAKLPRIELDWPKTVVGNNTVHAMQSGVMYGYLELVDGLIERIRSEEGDINTILATGGLGQQFAQHSRHIKQYEANLTLLGLQIIASLNLEAG